MSALGFPAAMWPRISALLDEAIELRGPDRERWLLALAGNDADTLRPILRRLLDEADAADPALPGLDADLAHHPGQIVGPYRLVHLLGAGGMGGVWLARRADGTLQRPVALKLPRTASSPLLAERLARERDVLAALSHPNIAQLLDAGVAADGQPFLALEVVVGVPIDRWCAERAPALRERLELFLQVARAVAHAHAKLVVHRDLKPSNLLVTADGQVKLLDFGIAKLLSGADAALTQHGARAMTPQYAAPEQVAGQAVDTRADVYALGLVLFELLTGRRPYRLLRDTAAALEEAILSQEPVRPSDAVADRAARRALRGDLDTIVAKALKKSPDERYATVEALAEDIERHLAHRPVLARPDSVAYVLLRLVRRHRIGFAALAVAAFGMVGGAGVAAWHAHRAELERQRASAVSGFVTALLRDATPYRPAAASWRTSRLVAGLMGQAGSGGDVVQVSALDLLRRAARQLEAGTQALHPEPRAELMRVVAEGLAAFGDASAAHRMGKLAVEQAARHLGEQHPQTLRNRLTTVQLMRLNGQGERVVQQVQALLPALRELARRDAEPLVMALQLFAVQSIDAGAPEQAQAAASEAAALLPRLPATSLEQVAVPTMLARLHRSRGDAEASRRYATQALTAADAAGATPPHPARVEARVALARALADLGRAPEATGEYDAALAESRALLGPDSPLVAFLLQTVVPLDLARGDLVSAGQRSAEALRIVQQHPPGAYARDAVVAARAVVLLAAGARGDDAGAALAQLDAALPTLRRTVGLRHEQTLTAEIARLTALARTGRAGEARGALAELAPSLSGYAAKAPPGGRGAIDAALGVLRRELD